MKNTFKTLPIILYPYICIFCLAGCFIAFLNSSDPSKAIVISLIVILCVAVICSIYSFVTSFSVLRSAKEGKVTAQDLAKLNMIIKLVQIPAYIIHFVLGILGLLMSVWGIPVILWAIIIDFLTILLSGIVNISANICGRNENILSSRKATLFSFLGFIYCIDVVISIVLYFTVKKMK